MGLKLWELFDLALPLIVMLLAQSILMAIFAYFIIFSFMGKDYDAAVKDSSFPAQEHTFKIDEEVLDKLY